MSPEFAAAIDPPLLEIIAILDRVRRGETSDSAIEQSVVQAALSAASSIAPGTRKREWELAKYALVCLLDDQLIIDVEWAGQRWWEEHCLEYREYSCRNRSEDFFLRAEEACGFSKTDALEVFIVAVLLGFRGKYRDQPEALEKWLLAKQNRVRVGLDRPALDDVAGELAGARPQYGRTNLVWASIFAALAAAMAVVTLVN